MSNIPIAGHINVPGMSGLSVVQSSRIAQLVQQQQQQISQGNQQIFLSSIEFNHQTFQTWIDILVDMNSSEESKLKAIQDLSLNLEVQVYQILTLKALFVINHHFGVY